MASLIDAAQASERKSQEHGTAISLIRFDQVGKHFASGAEALNNLTFDVRAGEFVSLLGASGCGKTTVLRLIAGLLNPTRGKVLVAGGAPGMKSNNVRLKTGFVFQEATLMPWATVRDNVFLPLRLAGQTRKQAHDAIDDALARVGLEGHGDAFPRELSGGMKMRVSIARALAPRPQLLLMDEPFAALDEITRFRLNNDVLRLWSDLGLTVVFVTHSVYESVYLSGRLLVMRSRPGCIATDLPLSSPWPREDDYRTTPAFGTQCREASAALGRAMAESGETGNGPF